MANIMINQICNLRCPYCFANEFVNSTCGVQHRNNMSLDDFKNALEFVLTEPNEKIGIIGGEPTLHPNFKEMLEIIINDTRIASAVIFTNGTFLEKYLKILTHPKFRLLINCNSPSDIGQAQYDKMVSNLDAMVNGYYMKDKIAIGINMYKEHFEYDYMLDLVDRYGFKMVRTSIVVPNTNDKKNANALEYFRRMKGSVFAFFKALEEREVLPSYDCNLMPTCVTTTEEKIWLSDFSRFENGMSGRMNINDCSNCLPVIDILPDLTAVRCFGMSSNAKAPIKDFNDISELRNYFYNLFDVYAYNVVSSQECRTCELRAKMRCTGGCIAFKANKIAAARNICGSL